MPYAFFFSSRRRHTRYIGDWSSDVCSSDLFETAVSAGVGAGAFRSRETVNSIVAELNRAGAGLFEARFNKDGNGLELRDLARSEERRVGEECRGRWCRER